MLRNWLVRLLHWLVGEGERLPPPSQPPAPARPPLVVALEGYHQALDSLADDPQTLLPVLLARDQVEDVLGKARPLPVEGARQLLDLDGQLRHKVTAPTLKPTAAVGALSTWRQTFHPSNARWWWFLDQKTEEWEKEQDLVWVLLTGTLLLLTATLTVEILKRLWAGAPDLVSVFASLLTLVVTASPLVKRGQELAQWTLKRIPWLKPRFRAEAMAGMAAFAFVAVLAGWLLLPQLALIYNNQGFAALWAGDLTEARPSSSGRWPSPPTWKCRTTTWPTSITASAAPTRRKPGTSRPSSAT